MPLTTSAKMLLDAQKKGYAVGAFNAENMEMVQAIVAAAVEVRSPVIIQTTPSTLKYAPPAVYAAMVASVAAAADVPVAVHLDHGNSIALVRAALESGYTSVMIDGSALPFEDNIALVRTAVEMAGAEGRNIPVEAELGRIGGKEDNVTGKDGDYTDPDKAREFADRTGISSLAVAIGTAHGIYKVKPVLDVGRLTKVRARVEIPLVLHGASGLTDEDVRNCVGEGICKVNFATELRVAYTSGVRAFLGSDGEAFDPKKYGAVGREKVKEAVIARMLVCGCAGRI